MIAKPLLAMASLLLVAAVTPVTIAHDDNFSRAGDVDDGVAGTYWGSFSATAWAANPFSVAQNSRAGLEPDAAAPDSLEERMGCGCHEPSPPPRPPTLEDDVNSFLATGDSRYLTKYVNRGQMLCDFETLGDGSSPQAPDESRVDGAATGVGLLTDGNFDDGGVGGACHTNHYDYAPYNTAGCRDDGARASSLSPLAAPWIGAACDWKTIQGGTPSLDILMTCAATGVLDGIDDQPFEAVACALGFSSCVTNPVTCANEGVETCGSDFTVDGVNYGSGNTRTAYPFATPSGASFTNDGLNCPESGATMQVYVFDAVVVEVVDIPTVYPAATGDIWQVA